MSQVERRHQYELPSTNEISRAGNLIADHLLSQQTPQMLLDMDGVIFQADSLHTPQLTTPGIINTLRNLEAIGIRIGPATGRGPHVIEHLRSLGLQLKGPAVLEEGQTIIDSGITRYLGHPQHRNFMHLLKEELQGDAAYLGEWSSVRDAHSNGNFGFTFGNFQWQGECRTSLWFYYQGDQTNDHDLLVDKFEPILKALATTCEIDYETDIAVNVFRMQASEVNGNLGVIGVKGKLEGRHIDKGLAANQLNGTWVFAADGFGDTPLAKTTKERNGIVIGIEGNLDATNDAAEFLRLSDAVLASPYEFDLALRHALKVIGYKKKHY